MSDTQIEQATINNACWKACDTFRGNIDSSVYKDYVLTMLFLKYISDVWQDHYDTYRMTHSSTKIIAELMRNERFVLPADANFYTLYEQRCMPGNGERIDWALHAIELANSEKMGKVFQDISFNSNRLGSNELRNETLRHLLEDFNAPELNLRPSRVGALDIIGNAYEFLINNFASTGGKKAGEFYTPPEISQLMALLLDPKEGDEIYDPTCGSGSLLMKCGKLVRSRYGSGKYGLFGQESIGTTWALAKMNMFLHGEDNHRIEWGDTLRAPKLLSASGKLKKFDVVVANPPFSLEKWGHEGAPTDKFKRFQRGVPPPTKADYAFISHMVASMAPKTGRMAVVVALGVLFRSGAEARIRRKLIEENLLDAVISLPGKLFFGTNSPAAILLMRHGKTDKKVLFIDAATGFDESRDALGQDDLDRIMEAFHARKDVDRFARVASVEEIAENDFVLNISRYVEISVELPLKSLHDLAVEVRDIAAGYEILNRQLDKWRDFLGIADLEEAAAKDVEVSKS